MRHTFATALLAAAALSQEPQQPPPLTEEQVALFALLDEFDPLDTSKLPFVRYEAGFGEPGFFPRYGFLLQEAAHGFTIRGATTCQKVQILFSKGSQPWFIGSFKAAEFGELESELMADRDKEFRLVPLETDAIVLARAYARRGQLADVHRLWAALPSLSNSKHEANKSRVADFLIEYLNHEFVDPKVSWQDLLAHHDLWLARFGGLNSSNDKHVQRNRGGIAEVLAMKEERSKRMGGSTTPADLVFDLHDEFWLPEEQLRMNEDSLPCAEAPTRDGDTPLQRVKKAGLACVPDLIAALDDTSLTRCIRGSTRWRVTTPVAQFGDAARIALAEIAGFRPEGDHGSQTWHAWLEQVKASSIEAVRDARIDRLDRSAIEHAIRDRPESLARILKALRASTDAEQKHWVTFDLRRALGNPLPPPLLDYLAEAYTKGSHGSYGAEDARVLLEHGRHDIVPTVASDWLSAVRDPAPSRAVNLTDAARFLVETEQAAAWSVLAEGCAHDKGRSSLAWALAHEPTETLRNIASGPSGSTLRRCLTLLSEDESIVARRHALRFPGNDYQLHAATIADIAAATLAKCWPDEHRFDPSRTGSIRQMQRRDPRLYAEGEPAIREPALPPNLVTSVTFDAATAALPANTLTELESLEGQELTLDGLRETTAAVARIARGRLVVVDCERPGLGDGMAVRVTLLNEEPVALWGMATGDSTSRWAWTVTIGGKGERGVMDDAVREALASPAATGVELTFAMRID